MKVTEIRNLDLIKASKWRSKTILFYRTIAIWQLFKLAIEYNIHVDYAKYLPDIRKKRIYGLMNTL